MLALSLVVIMKVNKGGFIASMGKTILAMLALSLVVMKVNKGGFIASMGKTWRERERERLLL